MGRENVKERLKEYLQFKCIPARRFALSIGVSDAYVQSISKSIPPDKLERISELYPDLNLLWLLLGFGDMLNKQGVSKTETPTQEEEPPLPAIIDGEAWTVIKQMSSSLASKDRQVETLIDLLKKVGVRMDEAAGCADVG